MLTIFACPKPFSDPHIAIIQRNAITSWTLLKPRPEIILFADEPGTAEICKELGLRHVPKVARNEYGTPLLNDIFETAQKLATHNLLCYANADLILMSDFTKALQEAKAWCKSERFSLVGARRDAKILAPLDFGDPSWETKVRASANNKYLKIGTDFLVFPRASLKEIPPFVVGRWAWDGWLLWKLSTLRMPLIDASKAVCTVHQEHDYCHASDLELQKMRTVNDELARRNGLRRYWWLGEATHYSTPNGIKRIRRMGKLILWLRWTVQNSRVYRLLIYRLGPLRHRWGLRRATLIRLKHWLKSK